MHRLNSVAALSNSHRPSSNRRGNYRATTVQPLTPRIWARYERTSAPPQPPLVSRSHTKGEVHVPLCKLKTRNVGTVQR